MERKEKEQIDRYNDPFPTFLREKLESKDVTQQKLAEVVGVKRQTISAYSLGTSTPDITVISKFADYFGVSTDYLLGKSKTPLKADDLQMALSVIDTQVIDRITELKEGEANAGLRFINTMLNTNDFYKALVYLNKACKVKQLKEVEPSTQSSAYMLAVKITNAAESTKEVIVSGDSAIEYFTDKATKVIGEIFRDIAEGKEV